MTTLLITLPIFSLIGLGWLGARLGLFDAPTGAGLSRFVYWLAFPALLLTSMARAPVPDAAATQIALVWIGALLLAHLSARTISLGLGLSQAAQAGTGLAASCGNTAFLGTAILTSLFGPTILPKVAALVALENIIAVSLGVAGLYLTKPATGRAALIRTTLSGLFNPVSVGAMIGFALSLSSLALPPALGRPLDMLGLAASPAGLVALGIVIAGMIPGTRRDPRDIALVVAIKCALLPTALYLALGLIGADHDIRIAVTLLGACPSAVNVFIQARQAEVWADKAALAVLATTLVSVIGVTFAAGLR